MRQPLIALTLLALLTGGVRGQLGDVGLAVHHSFPEAGSSMSLVIEGAEQAVLRVDGFSTAPSSAVDALVEHFPASVIDDDVLAVRLDDPRGIAAISLPLGVDDVGKMLVLRVMDRLSGAQIHLQLAVQPPMVILPTDRGLARIDLLSGRVLEPYLSGPGALNGAALSRNGLSYYLLRDSGRLEIGRTARWDGPRQLHQIDVLGDDLAHSPATGPAFVIVRPNDAPFAPPGRLVFVDGPVNELSVEPMADGVDGRRWVITDDGMTAFVAEDDLLVREVDLVSGEAGSLFSAGGLSDRAITDMLWDDGRLIVLTRRHEGRTGGVSTFDMSTGWVTALPLRVDPIRVVAVDPGTSLVVPASGPVLETLDKGAPVLSEDLGRFGVEAILDACAVANGALLLARGVDGANRLLRWDAVRGASPFEVNGLVPEATRLVAAGHDVAVLLGDPTGELHRVDLSVARVEVLPGVRSELDAPFVVLP